MTIFILAPGAFFVLAGLVAIQNKVKRNAANKGKETVKPDVVKAVLHVETVHVEAEYFQQEMKNRRSTGNERITYYSNWFRICE